MENNRNILKESLPYILQYAQDKIDINAYFKALLGQNFTMDEIFKDKSLMSVAKNNQLVTKQETPEFEFGGSE